jgi:hypothetical protein
MVEEKFNITGNRMDENAELLVIVWRMKTKTTVAYHCNIGSHEKLNNLLIEIDNIVSL